MDMNKISFRFWSGSEVRTPSLFRLQHQSKKPSGDAGRPFAVLKMMGSDSLKTTDHQWAGRDVSRGHFGPPSAACAATAQPRRGSVALLEQIAAHQLNANATT